MLGVFGSKNFEDFKIYKKVKYFIEFDGKVKREKI